MSDESQSLLGAVARSLRGWRPREKVFCIGANKTGTTSVAALFESLGYKLAPQIPAERMIFDWAQRDFRKLIRFCRKYDAFQDIPFSLDFTFQAMDNAFPSAKFILTIRESPEEWFDSYVRFTRKLLAGRSEKSRQNLATINYNFDGFFLKAHDLIYGEQTAPFDRDVYIRSYQTHNEQVISYFAHRRKKLLVLSLTDPGASRLLADFLNRDIGEISIPHLNTSR
ncbi:MAG: hypothetical protein NTV93_08275 [Verrucomicrobia bacterium]|nr:hypothetical protein [Verrucomicrobiota bacterium]